MNRLATRVAGFAIPTVSLVTYLHLKEQASWGEAIDGLVSGASFTLPFALVGWVRSRFEGHRPGALGRSPGHEFALGLMASIVAWAAVWAGWSLLPSATAWRPHAFAINLAVMAVAGLMLPAAARKVRASGDAMAGEAAPGQP